MVESDTCPNYICVCRHTICQGITKSCINLYGYTSAMAETSTATKRYAVVTGANKGIGLEICRQLTSHGIVVVLTARDEEKGLEAVQKMKDSGISDNLVVFHRLDVADPDSIASLVEFVKTKFGKLDILVNNAAISGAVLNPDAFQRAFELSGRWPEEAWKEIETQSFELAEQCIKTNYYGVRGMVETLTPLLQLSDSARIINVTSKLGLLKNIPNARVKGLLNDVESLTGDRIDEIVEEFLRDFKEGLLTIKGWPTQLSAYSVAKAAVNAYTRILAKRYPNFHANCVSPGYCKTDLSSNTGHFTAAEGAEGAVRLALLPDGGPSGFYFYQNEMLTYF
ncbi:(+)-neomenthol dehydrogenase [Salix suchowensis]|nr:(+)-neomenthol dehydrogenase [Salix suchowensis]